MSNLQIFNNSEFGAVRTTVIDGEPWFVGKDVASILGYSNPLKAIRDHVDVEDKGVNETVTPGGVQELVVINESGLYSLILRSQLQSARKFKRWVTSEVLPAIRRTGTYTKPKTAMDLIRLHGAALQEVDAKIESVKDDLEAFKHEMPLLAVDCDRITTAVKKKGVELLGGKESPAYQDRSTRGKVYSDIHRELQRQFGISSYKALRRSECDRALSIISLHHLPLVINELVDELNSPFGLA